MRRDDVLLLVEKPLVRGLLRRFVDVGEQGVDSGFGLPGEFFVRL